VVILYPDFYHAKSLSHNFRRTEDGQHLSKPIIVGTKDLDVEIMGLKTEQPIAHAATDQVRFTDISDRGDHLLEFWWDLHRMPYVEAAVTFPSRRRRGWRSNRRVGGCRREA